jgi:hypothetical protein
MNPLQKVGSLLGFSNGGSMLYRMAWPTLDESFWNDWRVVINRAATLWLRMAALTAFFLVGMLIIAGVAAGFFALLWSVVSSIS